MTDFIDQPPSGGCVLKPDKSLGLEGAALPAAFGRLCVETILDRHGLAPLRPAAFGRLCVETLNSSWAFFKAWPAAFGRLCVETIHLAI